MTVSLKGRGARLRAAIAIIALALVGAPTLAHAESYDFTTDLGGLNQYDPFSNAGPFSSFATFTVPGADGTLRVQNNENPFLDLFLGPGAGTARAGVYGNTVYTDFTASLDVVDWDTTNDQVAVLGARGQNVGLGTTSGYFAGIDFISGSSLAVTYIGRVDNEVVSELDFSSFLVDTTHDYRIAFQGIGSQLDLAIFDLTGASQVATVSAVDSTYSSGNVGAFAIGVLGSTTPVDITFDNLTANAVTVPESSTLGLLAVGVGGAAFGIIRRKRALAC